ncbi:zinc finger protein Xfin isoform X1 [Drosophila novamexicana]|uniref:zinc finger protein Xfin isoform X1 n=1 Tax=Drosophila novamexicana TaxID=47314 RepID=UPI0011E5D508|nr:zinc finger protein Xfin isoform X1 [Drosophila novamexicana]
MTRVCRICGSGDGRYWIETPLNKYADKTYNQLLLELTKLEVALDQADKLPPWICRNCTHSLENAYDLVLKARETHELWLQKMSRESPLEDTEIATLECLQETPIQLLDIEGITIKMEEPSEPVTPSADPTNPIDPLIKKSIVVDNTEDDDDDDDVPLKQRRTAHTKLPMLHKCNKCDKAFKYVTNLFRHKQRDHSPNRCLTKAGEVDEKTHHSEPFLHNLIKSSMTGRSSAADLDNESVDNYYKCDQCDKSYKYIMLLIKHKHKAHVSSQLAAKSKSIGCSNSSTEETLNSRGSQRQHSKPSSTDSLVHSIIKEINIPDEDTDNSSVDNYYKCDQCDKSYKYIVSLIKHKHNEHKAYQDSDEDEDEAATSRYTADTPAILKPSRIDRRVKGFDLHRCKPNGSKEIQCMICLRTFIKLRELREHLKAHPKDFTFEAHGEPIERIAEGFYKTAVESTVAGLKRRIFNDLKVGMYGRYYSITNEARYEMNLDSSDTDSDGEGDVVERHSYACELCESPSAVWPRKYQLHEHHRQEHTWLEAPHVCQRCDSRFLSAKLLDHHTLKLCQNTLKRFMCDKCPQRFFWRRNLRAHLVEHKNKQDTYPCDQCSRSFQDKSAVTKHKLMHHDVSNELLPCRWCTRTFYRPALLHKHVQRHGFSGEDLPLAETLLADAAKASGPKTIICKLCDMQFVSIADLRRHFSMQAHSEQATNYMISTEEGFELLLDETDESDNDSAGSGRSYKCALCDMNFQRRRDMSEHQYSLHTFDKLPYSCEHCIYKTVDKSVLEQHLRTQCLNQEKKFKCSRCGYKFMWRENLEQHMSSQHPKSSNQAPVTIKRSRRFRYQCPHCWRSFVVQPSLDKHIRDMHVAKKNPGKKYLCSLCGLESLTPNKLNIHMRRHNGEKPFKCDLCDMSFTVHYELKVHRRKHTGERPYQCTFCAKDFARPDKLRRHVYMHSVKR